MCECKKSRTDLRKIESVLEEKGQIKGSLISILQKAQEIYGYLPTDVIYHIAERTGSTPAKVLGVATFYTQFRFKPVGKYLILVCKGTACHVNGADRIMQAVCDELGIEDGGSTDDGLFSVKSVACLGCCSLSPVMMIGETAYGSLTPDKARGIIREIAAKEAEGK